MYGMSLKFEVRSFNHFGELLAFNTPTLCSYAWGSLWTPHAQPHLGLPKRFLLF